MPNASLATHNVRIAIVGTKRSAQQSSRITRSHHIHREHFSTPAMLQPWGSRGKLTFCVRKAVSRKTGKMHKKILLVETYLQHEHLGITAWHRALRTWSGIANIVVHRKGNWYKRNTSKQQGKPGTFSIKTQMVPISEKWVQHGVRGKQLSAISNTETSVSWGSSICLQDK